MVRSAFPRWSFGAVLLGVAACEYGYELREVISGPPVSLDADTPSAEVHVRACIEGATASIVEFELRASARRESPVASEVRVALSREPVPDEWDVSYIDGAVDDDGVKLALLSGSWPEDACETGQSFSIERVDAELEGVVAVDWTVVVRASGDEGLRDHGEISIHLD